eukprot:4608023-Prymnesium_polylepis.1
MPNGRDKSRPLQHLLHTSPAPLLMPFGHRGLVVEIATVHISSVGVRIISTGLEAEPAEAGIAMRAAHRDAAIWAARAQMRELSAAAGVHA